MRIITLEEHFSTPGFLDGPGQDLKNAALKFEGRATRLIEQLTDIADKRIAAMDSAGIDMQVLSLTSPGTEQLDAGDAVALSREVNDFLAAGVKKNPKRFAGFATLPTAVPDKAAAELESRMKSGGFVGAVINGHNRGRYLDDKFFWPILEAAEALNAPIHIHPTRPPQPVVDAYYSGFSPLLDDMFASPGWGWHIET
ncbi:MAG: amidohydrolase family protein, partial [Xanthobacteraceae bacterium]